jgi:tetratricopeptide (TPR) repeat protein
MKFTLALMALFVLAGAQDPLAEALRKGIVQEETNQNLDAAIQSYQSLLTQFGEERKTAATALFRLAECYRKQGKNDLAVAAYKRLVSEFADQTKLAEQSRTVLAQTFKVQPPQTTGASNPQTEEARRRYRETILAQIKAVQAQMAWEQKKFDLGESRMLSVLQVQNKLAELLGELAAFDAGPGEAAAVEARRQQRAHLERSINLAKLEVETAQKDFNLGKLAQLDVNDAEVKLLELQRKLAALDAGINQR